jgi:hypothetical protein
MSQEHLYTQTLGEVAEDCYEEALLKWRRDTGCQVRINDLLGNDIKEIMVNVTHKRGGRVDVLVSITARIHTKSDAYFWRFARRGQNAYVRVEK